MLFICSGAQCYGYAMGGRLLFEGAVLLFYYDQNNVVIM